MSQPSLAKVPRVVADRKAPVDLRVRRALRAYKVHKVKQDHRVTQVTKDQRVQPEDPQPS